ncbi:MAG: hypothetical protein HY804_00690 [Nitrospinae bacterium]|nr:hypothetical protein [Nitrospinota bacterium]
MRYAEYFLPDSTFRFIKEIRAGERPWSALDRIGDLIAGFTRGMADYVPPGFETSVRMGGGDGGAYLLVTRSFKLGEPLYLRELALYAGEGTLVEAGAFLRGPLYVGEGCEIRHGAYLRGEVIVGDGCVIGHASEIKNSIIMNRSNAGHFNYVGDSVIGSRANLGAGTILANLQFRGRDEIDSGKIKDIFLREGGQGISSGRSKLGAVVGDYCEIGCNTVTAPGALIGSDCWIYPNTTVGKGVYPPRSVIRPASHALEIKPRPGKAD